MREVIPIEGDRHVCAIKVLDGRIEHYRVAAAMSATRGRVRFRLDGIVVDARLCEQNTTPENLQALADQGALVVAGVFQKRDGTHKLDWLAPSDAPPIASGSMQVQVEKTWRSLPGSLIFALLQMVFSFESIWHRSSRRRTLQLMESVMRKYCGPAPRREERLCTGDAHGR